MTLPDVAETRRLLMAGHTSAGELASLALRAIEVIDPELGAFVSVGAGSALRQAAAADDLIRSRGPAAWRDHPLLGVTVAVKDLVQTADLPTTRGSLLPNHRPAVDAPAVARLRAAGAIVLGKTTTSEYGWSGSTVSRVAAPTRNPWDPDRASGGSSGGSAAAVAAGLCTVALGTDGAGSIRIPAAFCGVVGYKPTFGLVPYVPPCADLLAHLGPIGRTVADVAAVADVMAGADVRDPDSLAVVSHPAARTRRLRVAWLEVPGTTAPVRSASERLAAALDDLGHDVQRVERPFEDPYRALADLLAAGEAAGFSEADTELGDPGRLALARYGRALPAAAVGRAMEARMELRVRMAGLMERYDLLALATVPVEPFAFDAIGPDRSTPAPDWLAWAAGTYPFNLTGQPAVSVPVGLTTTGLPAGGQIVGGVGHDRLVLAVAEQVQRHLPPLPDLPRTATKG